MPIAAALTAASLSINDRRILAAVGTGTAALSLGGSSFIVLCYLLFKELRKFSFKLVFFLALSDMFCSFFSIIGLNSTRADKLVFIHSNIRLLSRFEESYKEGPFKKWDINPEANIIDDSHVRLEELRWESLDINDVDGQKDEMAKDQSNVPHGSKLLGQSSAASSNIPRVRSQEMRSTQSQMTRFLQQRAPLDPKAKGKKPQ